MTRSSQKEDELGYLRSYLWAVGVNGTVTPLPDGSGPDYLLEVNGQAIGVEITEYSREAPATGVARRQMEGIRDQVLRGAVRASQARSLPPVEVHVYFNEHNTPSKGRVEGLVTDLIEAVLQNLPTPGGHRLLGWQFGDPGNLPAEVAFLSMIRRDNAADSRWLCIDADYVPPVSADHLQGCISAKNQKVERYRNAAPEVWLLVVFDSGRCSGVFDLNSAALDRTYESAFNRTIVFDGFSGTVRELATCRPGSTG